MPLDPTQRAAFDCFYPGLIAKLEALDKGAGKFDARPPAFRPRLHNGVDGIGYADLRTNYFIANSEMFVEIVVQLRLNDGEVPLTKGGLVDLPKWKPTYYSLGYQKKLGDRVFAFELDSHGPHVHMKPNIKEHVPVDETAPNTFGMDPRDFVDLVAKYRNDKIYPVKRLTTKRKKP